MFDAARAEKLDRFVRQRLWTALDMSLRTDQLQDYAPYEKQLFFHQLGAKKRNRLLAAGNQQGKTYAAGAEWAMHITGEYPSWWRGFRIEIPGLIWVAGRSGKAVRDNIQRALFGSPQHWGTGWIPKRCLTPIIRKQSGTPDLIDVAVIKHITGGLMTVRFMSYDQDRESWQGPPVLAILFDEEPPQDMFAEGMARTIATGGITAIAASPLKGRSDVYERHASGGPDSDYSITEMSIYDAKHIPPERIQAEIERWPEHERVARIWGKPYQGEGLIYPVPEHDLVVEPFPIPPHWPQICGIDFGIEHPTAAVRLAIDPESGTIYVVQEYRAGDKTPAEHMGEFRNWPVGVWWAWPRDGRQRQVNLKPLEALYREQGLRMLREFAQFPQDASTMHQKALQSVISIDRGITDILQRMKGGRFKVFRTCRQWLDERRQYHRKDLKIVSKDDDLLDATRVAYMCLRFATAPGGDDSDLPRRGARSGRRVSPTAGVPNRRH